MGRSKLQAPISGKAPSTNLQSTLSENSEMAEWNQVSASTFLSLNDGPMEQPARHPFDLEERTARFGEKIIRFVKRIPRGVDYPENNRLIDQLVGAGTSIGANYCEANEGVSKRDFRHPISRCVKEAKETRFFLRMVASSEPSLSEEARDLYREANELVRIFASIYRK